MDRRNDPASLRESWFEAKPEHSVSSAEISVRDSQVVVVAPRNSSLLCGAFVGLVAAAAMIMIAMTTSHADVARAIGTTITKGGTGAESATGIGAMMLTGILFGAGFARATIHVERMLPIAIFGIVFAPIAWVALHVFVLARVAPLVAAGLPVGGLVIGAAVAGLVLSFVVPLRGGVVRARPERVSIA